MRCAVKPTFQTTKGRPEISSEAAGQRLIHRRIGGAVARYPALLAERLKQSLANRNPGVFGRVVLINVEVANRLHSEINERMARQLFEHMIEKADPGRDVIDPRPVEVERDIDRGFAGFARDGASAHGRRYSNRSRVRYMRARNSLAARRLSG